MSIKYLTGKTRTLTFRIDFTGKAGASFSGSGLRGLIQSGSFSFSAVYNAFNDSITGNLYDMTWYESSGSLIVVAGTYKIYLNNQLMVSKTLTGYQTLSGYIQYNIPVKEAVVIEDEGTYTDEVGNTDYPLRRKMRIIEIIDNDDMTIDFVLDGVSHTETRHYDLYEITDYHMNISESCNARVDFVYSPPDPNPPPLGTYTNNNSTTFQITSNGISYILNSLSDNETQPSSEGGIYYRLIGGGQAAVPLIITTTKTGSISFGSSGIQDNVSLSVTVELEPI